jgi:hypothetical protein
MGFENPVVGGTALRIPAIQSPNYDPGLAGWIIKINGDAEFNNLTIRGQFFGTDFIINSSGIFFYSGTPAAGNMTGSWAQTAGSDAFGNAYPAGIKVYSATGSAVLSPVDGSFLSTGSSGATVRIGDGELDFKASPTDNSTATLIQNFGGPLLGSLAVSGGTQNASDNAAYAALVTKAAGTDPQFLVRADAGGQLSVMNDTIDQGRGIQAQVSITANVTPITTETVLMTIPSMVYKNGRAYRVTLWGLAASTTASTFFLFQLRKGAATIAGTVYKGQMRLPTLSTASTNNAVPLTVVLVNTSGADITTAVTWTATCNAGTGTFAASAGNVAHATVEDVGLAAQWPGQPIS